MLRKTLGFLSRPAAWITLVSLVWAAVFALDLLPILRGGYDWEWHYKPVLERFRIAPLIVGVICYIVIGLWLRKRRSATSLLIWSVVGGIGLALAAVHVRGDILYRLYSLTVSGRASGWQMAAMRIPDISAALANWPAFMVQSTSFSSHIDHSPPGIVIIYYAAGRLLDRLPGLATWMAEPLRWQLCQYLVGYTSGQYASAWLGMLTPLWASFTALPLYYLGRAVINDEAARWSVLWWPLVPSVLVFAPLPYTAFALLALAMMALLWIGLRSGRAAWIVAAGVVLSVLLLLNFVFIPLLLFAGLVTLGMFWLRSHQPSAARPRWHWPFLIGLWFGLGLAATWLLFAAITGTSAWDMLMTAQRTQYEVSLVRPYWPFLAWNVNDFSMFTGWPLTLLAAVGAWAAFRKLTGGRDVSEGDVMIAAAALTLVLVGLSGTPRGETGRLLMFLSPWVLLAAASVVGRDGILGGLMTALQGVALIVMVVCLQVLAPEFRARAAPVAPAPQIPALSPVDLPVGATFGNLFRLASAAGRIDTRTDSGGQSEPTLYLWLTWHDLKTADIPYDYTFLLVGPDGTTSGTATEVTPFTDAYPMTCWQPGAHDLIDRVRLPLPASISGEWWVKLSVVDPATGEPLPATAADGTPLDNVKLGPFQK